MLQKTAALVALSVCAIVTSTCGKPKEEAKRESGAASGNEVVVSTQAQTQVYRCKDGKSFTLRVLPDTVWLELPNRTVRLPRDNAASGRRFSNGDVDFSITTSGVAQLETEEQTYTECRGS